MCWLFIHRHSLIAPNEKHFYRRVYKGVSEFLYLRDTFLSVEVYSILLPFPSFRFAPVQMTYNVGIFVLKLTHLFFGNMVEDVINIAVKLNGKLMGEIKI
jgi:hypothetical protein